jgi:hypothetical protein
VRIVVAEAEGQSGNPEERERLPLEAVGSRYQMTGEHICLRRLSVCHSKLQSVCEIAIILELIVVMNCNSPINPVTNLNPTNNHPNM